MADANSSSSVHVLIVEARFYEAIADELVKGAIRELEKAGATFERVAVPGAFEIPAAIRFAADAVRTPAGKPAFHGFIALGCVIRGETSHYDYVCGESARALQDLAIQRGLAVGYGILTVDNEEQAWARVGLHRRDKGGDAARACLAMVALKRTLGLVR
jgi:6,7-dimethyl-8-ribityllumazine synthase